MIGTRAGLELVDGGFCRNGRPHQILAGSMHPFRVHPDQWADRISRVAAMGCNAVDTYVAWNQHQPEEHRLPSFDGGNDLARFAELVAAAGLDLIVRPGPYICAEWDNGGFPAWLTRKPGIELRSSDPTYQQAVSDWFDVLVPELVPLQASHGGPVIAVQVENEFGSYSDDHAHIAWLRHQLTSRGITEFLFTADGSTWDMQEAGSIPGVFAAATFGSHPTDAADLMRRRRPGAPLFAAEFWGGWFDHWGEPHHVRGADDAAANIARIVGDGGSVSVYMAHGGTNFGLRAGANHDGTKIQPTVTSYDSDAPIAEDGTVTAKFTAIRRALRPDRADDPLPPPPPRLAAQTIPVVAGKPLLDALTRFGSAQRGVHPRSFEDLRLDTGLVLYTATATIPAEAGPLRVLGLHDRATIMVDGSHIGTLEHETETVVLPESIRGTVQIDVIVENLGRINYGPRLGEGKGILGGVLLGRRFISGWSSHPVPLDRWTPLELRALRRPSTVTTADKAGIYSAELRTRARGDAFLALPGFRKGFAWIDGFLLGRYWNRGPQQTLYIPQPLVHDRSVLTVLELEEAGEAFEIVTQPKLGEPEPYVETF